MKRTPMLLLVAALLHGSGAAQAHKRWLLPTDFSLSEAETVTVDFSASNNLFYVDKPMPLDGITIVTPGGESRAPLNPVQGSRRSSFDVEIGQQGTYRIVASGQPVYFSSYRLPGQTEKLHARGPLEKLRAELPAQALELQFARSTALIETYITLGAETTPVGPQRQQGLAMQPLSHPNSLYSDEVARFRFTLDGEPIAGMKVVATPEGTRYRDRQLDVSEVTDERGEVGFHWGTAGRYLLEAMAETPQSRGDIAVQYYNYFVTVEVLAP
ncbi:MAG: DUF4198 domain-containing protein [Halioglobus sp.]